MIRGYEKHLIILSLAAAIFYFTTRKEGPIYENNFENVSKFSDSKTGPWCMEYENISVCAIQGRRDYMEDRFSILDNRKSKNRFLAFGVFDGHGGTFFSQYAETYLLRLVYQRFQETPSDSLNLTEILMAQFLQFDQLAMLSGDKKQSYCGSTGLVGIIYDRKLYVANTGDCRAVAKQTSPNVAVKITKDHKPNDPIEKSRIESAGGTVAFVGVWRVDGKLAVSRAFGDGFLKERGLITAAPDIFVWDLNDKPLEYVIFASDGLWDVVDSHEAVDFITSNSQESFFGAKNLVNRAFKKGSQDNISVMVIKLI